MGIYFFGIAQKAIIFLLIVFACTGTNAQTDTSLILNEIMFYPQTGNNEFIELFNLSGTQTLNLFNYQLKYSTSNPDVITDAGFGTLLPPNSYAVIFEGDYDISSGIYAGIIPPEALILKISDNSFGSTGMSNSEDRIVWLIDPESDTLEACFYKADNSQGHSEEKKQPGSDSSQSNWGNSISFNGTPGSRNSITPVQHDLILSTLNISPEVIVEGDDVNIYAVVKNIGSLNASEYTLEIFNDTDMDSIPEPAEKIFTEIFYNLLPGDSVDAEAMLYSVSTGNYRIISRVVYSEDENPLNDRKDRNFTVYVQGTYYNDIITNEVMYAPQSPEPEWVELFNRSSQSVNIKKWRIFDAVSSALISDNDNLISPGGYLVLTADSSVLNYYNIPCEIIKLSLPIFNNTGDAVVIKDSLGIVIDSVLYSPDWGGSTGGYSLERKDPDNASNDSENWGSSISSYKATPGLKNSLTLKEHDLRLASFKPIKDYEIIGENAGFEIKILNSGIYTSAGYEIKVYNDANADSIPEASELLQSLYGGYLLPGDSTIIDFNTTSFIQGKNYFICVIYISPDDDTTNNIAFAVLQGVLVNEIRNDLIINEIMYAPNSPEPEWIEILNRSSKNIDLENYQVGDNSDTTKFIDSTFIITPGEYIIFSSDSTVLSFYKITACVFVNSLPSLNNTGDKIILLDSLNRVIDSVQYFPSWGGSQGNSLERIDSETAADSVNWSQSISRFKASPGYINSVTQKDYDVEAADIIFSPPFPEDGDNVTLSAKIKNNGLQPAIYSLILYEDTDLDSIPDTELSIINNLDLQGKDSSIVNFNYVLTSISGMHHYIINAVFQLDQDTSNNIIQGTIGPGLPPYSVVVNEIMYSPAGGEPEWVELFNNTADSVNIQGWAISDLFTSPDTALIYENVLISPYSFIVLTDDISVFDYHRIIPSRVIEVSLPNLNNDYDGVLIHDHRGQAMDSVLYHNEWGSLPGFSLERKDAGVSSVLSSNWNKSFDLEQSTPGRINSITHKNCDLSIGSIHFNPRFPVPGEDVCPEVVIRNNGSTIASSYLVEFYIDTDSNNIPELLLSRISGPVINPADSITVSSSSVIQDIVSPMTIGVKIIFTGDDDSLNNYAEKIIAPGFASNNIVINEVMYAPLPGKPEWIELVNTSADTINIRNWEISDIGTTSIPAFIATVDIYIMPGEYFIIAHDTSFYETYPEVTAKILISDFGSLANTGDGIIIFDFREGIIDSLEYDPEWGYRQGHSLERLSYNSASNDSSNWASSLSETGSTPGIINSITGTPDFNKSDLVINELMFDPDIDNSEFIEFFNRSDHPINVGNWKFIDLSGTLSRLSDTSQVINPGEFFLLISDSSTIIKYELQNYKNQFILGRQLNLNNSDELILLEDLRGKIIDSVYYTDKWHNRHIPVTKNRSLERINPDLGSNDERNWSTSVALKGATPGTRNSIFADNKDKQTVLSVSPNPFSPDNDGFEDYAVINYILKQQVTQIRIKVFDSRGRLVRTIANNQASGQAGSVIFDGRQDNGQSLRIGIYIIFLEALNDNSGVVETLKTTVVVARRL